MNKRIVTGIILVIVAITSTVGYGLYASQSRIVSADGQVNCQTKNTNHVVIIKDNEATPSKITAPKCDTLTLKNIGDSSVIMSFGEHVDHRSYDGVVEKRLDKGQSFTITLNKVGTYDFHDHIQHESGGMFTVTR